MVKPIHDERVAAIVQAKSYRIRRQLWPIAYELSTLYGGTIPLPQTEPAQLIKILAKSPPQQWRAILANEVLLYLERAYRAGHGKAVADARSWCKKHRLPVPDWLRDADRISQRGKHSAMTNLRAFQVDFARYLAVKIASAQKNKLGEKWEPARVMLAGSFAYNPDPFASNSVKALQKSCKRFQRFYQSYYFPPATLLFFLGYGLLPTEQRIQSKRTAWPVVYGFLNNATR